MTEKIGYARTSNRSESIETQILVLEKKGIKKIFTDEGVSGIIPADQRKGFSDLLQYTKTNGVSNVYVFELSRIGRSFIETLQIVKSLEDRGIMIMSVSPKEEWLSTTDKSVRSLIMGIFAWVAERERENLVERTKAGIERARNEGKHIGRPERQIDWKTFDKWYNKKIPIKTIARIMEVPYPTLYVKFRERQENGGGLNACNCT